MSAKRQNANIHGVMVVNKPQGFTSFDVIAKLRGILETRKIGHSGTLDPMATGVLPVFIGNATKAVDLQTETDKRYIATVRFGVRTSTGDITGETLEQVACNVTEIMLQAVIPKFVGVQQQIPPMYSAVKVNGQPLYKLARKGEVIERVPREVTIYSIAYLGNPSPNQFLLEIHCSKGTYIRTLLEDIGTALQCPATMAALQRTQSGRYVLADGYSLEQLETAKQQGQINSLLKPVSTVFELYPRINGTNQLALSLRNGIKSKSNLPENVYAVYIENVFLGIAKVSGGELRVVKLFENDICK